MNNDQYNNQNNPTYNTPPDGIVTTNDQYNNQNNPTYNTPVVVELLPTAVTNKNMTKDRTIILTVFFVIVSFATTMPVLGKYDAVIFFSEAYLMMPDIIRDVFIFYNLALSLIMIMMCMFRQYWATNEVLGRVSKRIILLICTISTFVLASLLYGYQINSINNSDSIITVNKDSDRIFAAITTVMMTPTIFINLYIIIFTIYFSWAILSYYKKSKSNIEKK